MSDLVRADTEVLEAYSTTATTADLGLDDDVEGYRNAWISFTSAPAVPAVEPPLSKDAAVTDLLARVHHLDKLPRALALALETLDANGDGALDEADGIVVADHPELIAFLYPAGNEGGDNAVQAILDHFDALDTAADGGDPDGTVSTEDLEAAAQDPNAPLELQIAARYLLDNPTLLQLVETGNDGGGPWASDGEMNREDVEVFLETNEHVRNIAEWDGWADRFDTADEGGDGDGFVSSDDLEAIAEDTSVPQDVRDAARFLLDNDAAWASLALAPGGGGGGVIHDFQDQVNGRLINGQAYVHDPEAAAAFVRSLPVPEGGGHGMPIWVVQDDAFMATANAALGAVAGDLTDTQQVISHLPETESALRNELITSFYDLLAQRADGVFADATGATAGDPTSAGHPGVNWLLFAPWASNGVHDVITGEMAVMGLIHPGMGARQGAADGNQWIFDDITSRYAAFVELYEASGGQPTTSQLETFFADNFEDGDLQIRMGFQAYVAAMQETDPAVRQQLMYQANTLVATHEQAGADPYLAQVATGPNEIATEFIDVQMGDHLIEVNHDLDEMANDANLVVDAPILDLDPVGLTNDDLSVGAVTYGTGDSPGAVDLEDIGGWEDRYDVSTAEWLAEEGQGTEYVPSYSPYGGGVIAVPVDVDPDETLEGTAAQSWPDYEDRMWNLSRLFEQLHTDPSLYDTSEVRDSIDVSWLDPDVLDSVSR